MHYVDSTLDPGTENRLRAWLDRELETASTLTLRTGFYSAAAVAVMLDRLEALLLRSGELLAVLGGEVLQVDLAGLGVLLDLVGRFPENARVLVMIEPVFQNAKTYHVAHADGRSTAWVGSANFTIGGLADNLEAAITLRSDEDDPAVIERVRAATLAASHQPTAAVLTADLVEVLQQRVRESRFRFGRTSLGPTAPLVLEHGSQLLDDLDSIASGDHQHLLVATGFRDLDDLLDGGLRPGTLTVVASRPGAGRSTLVLNMLSGAAIDHDVPSCLFTFDTSAQDVLLRVVSADTAIDHRDLRRARMTDADWTDTAERMVKISDAPLHVNAGPAPHLEGLCTAITAATAREHLALVAIDPVGAVLSRTFADNREREVAEVVRRLKALAMQLGIRIIVTAELGRQADYPGSRPSLTDLRDTDVLAQMADHVILLHRPDLNEPRHPRAGQADLIVAKNRHGRRGVATVLHHLAVARFQSLPPRSPDPAPAPARLSARPTPATARSTTPLAALGESGPEERLVGDLGVKVMLRGAGAGSPSVICLGRADPADDEWDAVTTLLERVTQTITCRRPGCGGPDPLSAQIANGLHTIDSVITSLDGLFWRAKISTPVVLVAHSIGAWIADQYAARWPGEVAGMVLIDPVNLTPWPSITPEPPAFEGNDGTTGYLRRPSAGGYAELARVRPTHPRRSVVISSSDGRWQQHPPHTGDQCWDPVTLAEIDRLWQSYQTDWVQRLNARHVTATTAGHLVHRDQPELVAAVVAAVVDAARARRALRMDATAIDANGGRLVPKK